jgi:hypothetical protein
MMICFGKLTIWGVGDDGEVAELGYWIALARPYRCNCPSIRPHRSL